MTRRILLSASLLALALPAAASAHARLLRTEPPDGAVLVAPPAALRVVFDDVVRPGPGIEAVRNGGGSILAGPAHVEGQRTLVIPLQHARRNGAFSVRWSIVSDDGHLESGIVAFAVGRGQPTPTASLSAQNTGPAAADVAARWLLYAGLLSAVGIALFTLAVRPRDPERVSLLLASAAAVTAVGAGTEAHRIGLDTRAGTALGATALAAVGVATISGAATLAPRLQRVALVLAPVLVLGPAFSGHAYDRGVSRLEVAADALHLLGAAAWVGALIGLVAFRDAPRRRTIGLALGGVALLGATGVVRAFSELRHVSQLWETSYGRALLVKAGILLVALLVGLLLRSRIRRRAGVELVFVAGIVVAVAFLVLLPPGRSIGGGLVRVSTAEPGPPPPPPPRGAVIVSKEMAQLGVGLELERRRTTAIVLSPAGGGLDGLDVQLNGKGAQPCGHGCYRVEGAPGPKVDVLIERFGEPLAQTFDVPPLRRPAEPLLGRIDVRFRTLRSVFFLETLASGQGRTVASLWRLEAPDRVEYQIPGGASGVIIGNRRWDRLRPDAQWKKSPQIPQLPQPTPGWASIANVHLVADDGTTRTITFADPVTPAFFELTFDAKTLLPRELHMTAASHFMVDRYVRFNAPRSIYPPR